MGTNCNGCGCENLKMTDMLYNENWQIGFWNNLWVVGRKEITAYDSPPTLIGAGHQ